ncbi:hypothetical protein LX32DRAFT_142133 [Colletotrichum zoysiae]|uniref:Uncharacterized protein n=1 Tax=Colletotrichum zoysiae TaxID=1216348 RepID=A0AAD9H776_9PEZI|nr:hypothetical protein LX32DRAFT_142133 [Colletotrichum zoysiae]
MTARVMQIADGKTPLASPSSGPGRSCASLGPSPSIVQERRRESGDDDAAANSRDDEASVDILGPARLAPEPSTGSEPWRQVLAHPLQTEWKRRETDTIHHPAGSARSISCSDAGGTSVLC